VDATTVSVPPARVERWVANFETRHGPTAYDVRDGALLGTADDGSTLEARLPFDAAYDGPPEAAAFAAAVATPGEWGVLLVRKGGFAVARMAGEEMVEHIDGEMRKAALNQEYEKAAELRDTGWFVYRVTGPNGFEITGQQLEEISRSLPP